MLKTSTWGITREEAQSLENRIGQLWISPHIKISKKAMNIMIDFMKHMFKKLANAAKMFSQQRKKNFLTENDMLAGIVLTFPPYILIQAKVHARLPLRDYPSKFNKYL